MKILFLTRFNFIEDKKDGGLLCSYRNFKLCCDLYGKNNVILCILTTQKGTDTDNIKYIQTEGNIFLIYLNYLRLNDRCTKQQKEKIVEIILDENVDMIFFDGSTFGQIIRNKKIRKIENVVFFHNVERQYTWEQVKKHSKLCVFRYIATRYNEKFMARYGNRIICLNKRDSDLLKRFYKRKEDLLFPITFDDTFDNSLLEQNREGDSQKLELLYIGSYYAHNYTGVIWFIEKVIPYIDVRLTIVGKNMEKIKDKIMMSNKLNIVGTVDDLHQYYRKADAIVMPIFMGGGMKVKTAEALMYGKTIFASKEALEGYEVQGTEYIFECNTAKDFINSINSYKQKNIYQCFHEEVREIFLEKYCTKNYLPVFRKIMDNKWRQ